MHRNNTSLSLFSLIARSLGLILSYWKAVLFLAFILSPIGPHLRWSYEYREIYGQRVYLRCHYLGSRGLITPDLAPDCPLFAILDAREWPE